MSDTWERANVEGTETNAAAKEKAAATATTRPAERRRLATEVEASRAIAPKRYTARNADDPTG